MVIGKKSYVILIFVLLLALTLSANAATSTFTNGGGTRIWNDANNWDTVNYPVAGDFVFLGNTAVAGSNDVDVLLIDANHTGPLSANAHQLRIGHNKTGDWAVEMTGGQLNLTNAITTNQNVVAGMTGTFDMSGGIVTANSGLFLGQRGPGTLNISDGTMNFNAACYVGVYDFPDANGIVNQTGGTVNVNGILHIPNFRKGTYNISAGTLKCDPVNEAQNPLRLASLKASSVGVLNISGTADVNCIGGTSNPAILIGHLGDGTVNMSGDCSFRMSGGKVRIGVNGAGSGQVNINGGTFTADWDTDPLTIEEKGQVDLENDGLLKLKNPAGSDWISRLEGYVDAGTLTTYDNTGRADVVVEIQGDYTVAYAAAVDFNIAWGPDPAIGDDTVPVSTVDLSWTAGDNTADTNGHIIFISTDEDAVTDAAAGDTGDATYLATTTNPEYLSYSVPNYGEQFYWRVDQSDDTNSALVYKGTVWSFTTTAFMTLDDFDSYADDTALKAVWSESPASSISLNTNVDYVADGNSMKIDFDNTGGSTTTASIIFSSAKDLSSVGLEAMSLEFKGEDDNPAEPFSVALKDSSGTSYAVAYDSPIDMSRGIWTDMVQWDIDLQDYADNGVDLTDVNELIIQIGDGVSTGSGSLYIDEIAFVVPRCIPDEASCSFNNDCIANIDDLDILSDDWLLSAGVITAVAPNSAGLRAHYKFDETSGNTATDSTANGFDGTVTDGTQFVIDDAWDAGGKYNGCLAFGDEIWVECPNEVVNIPNEITISVWVNGDAASLPHNYSGLFCGGRNGYQSALLGTAPYGASPESLITCVWRAGNLTTAPWYDDASYVPVDSAEFEGAWVHYAFVKNAVAGVQRLYINGLLMTENDDATLQWNVVERFTIGALLNAALSEFPYIGKLDDFRVYDYALSQAEIVSLADLASVNQDIGILSNADTSGDNVVNFEDFALMAERWLETDDQLWP